MIIDISQPLSPGMTGFQGTASYVQGFSLSMAAGAPVNVGHVALSTHCGTHADAPLHYDAAGAAIAALPLDPFIGPCRVVDARGAGSLCRPEDVAAMLSGAPPRILLRLLEESDPKRWPEGFRALAPETVDLLAGRGVTLVGIDAPSVDPECSKRLPAHHACRVAGMCILENLVLQHVEPGDYELIALPLRFEHMDASPVRAVLRR